MHVPRIPTERCAHRDPAREAELVPTQQSGLAAASHSWRRRMAARWATVPFRPPTVYRQCYCKKRQAATMPYWQLARRRAASRTLQRQMRLRLEMARWRSAAPGRSQPRALAPTPAMNAGRRRSRPPASLPLSPATARSRGRSRRRAAAQAACLWEHVARSAGPAVAACSSAPTASGL
jgi:hypothetical protein